MRYSRFYCGVLVGALAVWVPGFVVLACGTPLAPKSVDCKVEWDKLAREAGCALDAGRD